ncbi:hypothetical protein ASPWEDRAFT_169569 [Aspergillus wentii DTO 134E9]|uniref:Uncharacterized protein n=1 Tax=Aspergillus wentii DTO 134E9 TaxID=1073089 RepID=A0A1L9RXX2_ASPWE|nr:uncharacterized protein ASPWEDRAFT_169569 [Aspergillus wentii DTO 134E9]OJJ39743.1 hypothetical protein ASPWEDRAFT_169569 [Aspergillus wentii DTO 134E9]
MSNRNSQRFQAREATAAPPSNPPLQGTITNPLKAFLDEGTLNTKKTFRNFTTFLDLKHNYHNEFLSTVWDHVELQGYTWKDLAEHESERKACALGFLRVHGKKYWGTDANRRKYLMADSLLDPEALYMYPERKEELTRTLVILLEKKAKAKVKDHRQSLATKNNDTPSSPSKFRGLPTPTPASDLPKKAQPRYPSTFNTPGLSDNGRGRKRDREPSEDLGTLFERFNPKKEVSSTRSLDRGKSVGPGDRTIRPFSSIALDDTRGRSVPAKKRRTEENDDVVILDKPVIPNLNGQLSDSSDSSTDDIQEIETVEKIPVDLHHCHDKTKFLVTATTQRDMAPVWVPFQRFDTASAFLDRMVEECGLREWDPSAQLNAGIWASPVKAASIKFEWSGFYIRVRTGMDKDWNFVMRELQKAWKKDAGAENVHAAFRISVMLHVV